MSGKKKSDARDEAWTSLEGNFTADDLRAVARGQAPIPHLSITRTRFTQPKAAGLRGMKAEWLWLWCKVTKPAMREVLAVEGLRALDVLEIEGPGPMPSFGPAATLEEFRCPTGLSTQDLEAVVQAPALKRLGIHGSKLDISVVRTLAAMPTLRHLDIEASNVDDEMIAIIASHPTLTGLDIGNTRVTSNRFAHICRMHQLESLDLWETAIGIDALQQLTALDRLEYLSLGKVDGSGTPGIRVEGNPSLDAGAVVDLLLRMPSLKRVWLDGIRLSPEQRRALRSRLEQLQN